MSTHSTIAMEQPDGRVMCVYAHWDGYLSNNGRILEESYQNRAKVLSLMLLGSISSLREKIGQPHDFSARYDDSDPRSHWTVAYGRDRGEHDTAATVFKDFADYKAHHQYEEYEYIYRLDNLWYVSYDDREYEPLAKALSQRMEEMAE